MRECANRRDVGSTLWQRNSIDRRGLAPNRPARRRCNSLYAAVLLQRVRSQGWPGRTSEIGGLTPPAGDKHTGSPPQESPASPARTAPTSPSSCSNKGYAVHGIKRRTSLFNTDRVDHLFHEPHEGGLPFTLHHGDMTDSSSLSASSREVRPDEVYNLAAQSHVAVSFEEPEYTANADALGTLRLLEAIRILGLGEKTRFYQASTSELYGKVGTRRRRSETTPFHPRSPYGVAKLYAHWITVNYREAYGLLRLQRHPVQSREPDPRRDLRHPQDHPRPGPHRAGHRRTASTSATSTPGATGATPRLCRGAVADAAAGQARATSSSPPASSTASANSSTLRRREPRHRRSTWSGEGRGRDRHRRQPRQRAAESLAAASAR